MTIGKNIIRRVKVSSTNSEAIALAAGKNCPDGTIIIASEQVSGRGRGNNRWESVPGMNLTISLVLYPDFLRPDEQFNISRICSLALVDLLSDYIEDISIKWPNDIWVNSDKIAGILIENSIQGGRYISAVAGMGININQDEFVGDAPNPVSLKQLTGKNHNLEALLNELCEWLDHWYSMLHKGEKEMIDSVYHQLLYGLNTPMHFESEGIRFEGIIRGVDESGRLLVDKGGDQPETFGFGDITFIIPPRSSH